MIARLEPGAPFPPLSEALPQDSEAPGLLAASRSLDPQRLLDAHRQGIFPWYSQGEPVLWCNTDPRMVLRDPDWQIRVDVGFTEVMLACAGVPRPVQAGTWITTELIGAYSAPYAMRQAHSIETWVRGERVGGLYGVAIGRMFFGESMFARATDASKIALAAPSSSMCEAPPARLRSPTGISTRRCSPIGWTIRLGAEQPRHRARQGASSRNFRFPPCSSTRIRPTPAAISKAAWRARRSPRLRI